MQHTFSLSILLIDISRSFFHRNIYHFLYLLQVSAFSSKLSYITSQTFCSRHVVDIRKQDYSIKRFINHRMLRKNKCKTNERKYDTQCARSVFETFIGHLI